jgi:FkbM family methyltransferase
MISNFDRGPSVGAPGKVRPPYHWKWGVSLRKRALRLRRLLGFARDGKFETCRYFGADFLVQYEGIDPNTYLGAELFLKRYEWLQIPRMIAACERLRPSAFIDVGAHFGLYTSIIGRRCRVPLLIAFEPNPNTIIHLKTHLMMNHLLDKVVLHGCAVGSENGIATLRPGSGPHSARSKIVDSGGPGGGYQVPIRPLDELIPINGQTIAIKIDVEYHEMSALKGAERLLSSNDGYAQVEAIEAGEKQAVIARMGDFGWQFVEVINDDVIFEKTNASVIPSDTMQTSLVPSAQAALNVNPATVSRDLDDVSHDVKRQGVDCSDASM